MSIGWNDYASLFQNYHVPVIPSVSVDSVKKAEETTATVAPQAAESSYTAPVANEESSTSLQSKKNAPLEDISITFQKDADFGYIGQDKNIDSLDMEKAIDDMQKDKVLQQYQYFVGSSQNLVQQSADGVVIAKGFAF